MSKMSIAERQQKRKQRALHNKIVSTFKAMGFVYYKTDHNRYRVERDVYRAERHIYIPAEGIAY